MITKALIRTIGNHLRANTQSDEDLEKLNLYRNTHILVMNTLINTIKDKTPKPLFIARRLKRLSSIKSKLKRFCSMQLDRMQDIGGVRAVFKDIKQAKEYKDKIELLYKNEKRALKIVKINDYVTYPKEDGYRGYHIVFEYHKGKEELKSYKIEFQIRDLKQHYWATAVEIFSLISKHNLKSGEGEEEHKSFFYLCSKLIHNEANKKELNTLKKLNQKHKILSLLSGINLAFHHIDTKQKDLYYLIALNFNKKQLSSYIFHKNELDMASFLYEKLEKDESINAVLIDIDSIKNLKKAYPNYFGNAKEFIKLIQNKLIQEKLIQEKLNNETL